MSSTNPLARQLDGRQAKLRGLQSPTRHRDGELRLSWDGLTAQDIERAEAFLAENAVLADPLVGRSKVLGNWRHVRFEAEEAPEGGETRTVQLLKSGYFVDSLPVASAKVTGDLYGRGARQVVLTWTGVDPAVLDALTAAVDAGTYADLDTAAGTLSGPWSRLDARGTLDEDGWGVVTLRLGAPDRPVAAYKSTEACTEEGLTYLYDRAVTPADAPASAPGSVYQTRNSIQPDGSYAGQLEVTNARPRAVTLVSRRTPFRAEDGQLYRSNPLPLHAPDTGLGGMYQATNNLRPDCTYDGELTYLAGLNAAAVLVTTREAGLRRDTSGLYRGQRAPVDAPVPGPRGIYTTANVLSEDGTLDAQLGYAVSHARVFPSGFTTGGVRREVALGVENIDVLDIDLEGFTDLGSARARARINEDLTYTGELTYIFESQHNPAIVRVQNGKLNARSDVLYRDKKTPPILPQQTEGELYVSEVVLQDDGLYSTRMRAQLSAARSHAWQGSVSPHGPKEMRGWRLNRRGTEFWPVDPAAIAYGVYETRQTLNEDGTYDFQDVYRLPRKPSSTLFRSEDHTLGRTDRQRFQGQLEKQADQAAGQRGVYRMDQRLEDDGTFAGVLDYVTSKLATSENISQETVSQRVHRKVWHNEDAPRPALEVELPGGLYAVTTALQQDGTFVNDETYRVTKPVEVYSYIERPLETVYRWQGRNRLATELPLVLPVEAGKLYTMSPVELQEDSTYNYTLELRRRKATDNVLAFEARHGTGYLYVRTGDAVPTSPIPPGTLADRSNSVQLMPPDPDGTFSAVAVSTPARVTIGGGAGDNWDNATASFGVYEREWKVWDGHHWYNDFYIEKTITQTDNLADAVAALNNGKPGSKLENPGVNQFRAVKVDSITPGTWTQLVIA